MKIKNIFFISIVLFLFFLCSCNPSITEEGGNDSQSAFEKSMTIKSANVSTIAPYSYTGAIRAGSSINKAQINSEYLSYAENGSSVFKPLVFETSTGSLVVFKDAKLQDAGDGFYLVSIGEVQIIKEEPVIIEEETDQIDEETGKPIVISSTVIMDVTRSYGSNNAIFDTNSGNVYLLSSPGDYLNINGFWSTDSFFYFLLFNNDNGKSTLYRINKTKLESGTLQPVTNSAVFEVTNVYAISDKYAVLGGNTGGMYLLDIDGNYSPSIIVKDEFKYSDSSNRHAFWDGENNALVSDGYLYDFTAALDGNPRIIGMVLGIQNGYVTKTGEVSAPIGYNGVLYSSKISGVFTGKNLPAFYYTYYGDSKYTLFCVIADGMDTKIKTFDLEGNDRAVKIFKSINNRVYWISGVNNNRDGSEICYHDFSTGETKRFHILGKPVANDDFGLSDNGTVVFWQYLSSTEAGTFSWNPEREENPTLLMITDEDVHSIVNIDKI